MKNKSMLIVILMGSILSFLPQNLCAFPKWSVPLPPTIRFGDFKLTCEAQASREYDACLEEKEEQCKEELQPYTPTIAGAPYLVCPSNEEITDLPCRERSHQTFETCSCWREAYDEISLCRSKATFKFSECREETTSFFGRLNCQRDYVEAVRVCASLRLTYSNFCQKISPEEDRHEERMSED